MLPSGVGVWCVVALVRRYMHVICLRLYLTFELLAALPLPYLSAAVAVAAAPAPAPVPGAGVRAPWFLPG